jgi:hypothetical protein
MLVKRYKFQLGGVNSRALLQNMATIINNFSN